MIEAALHPVARHKHIRDGGALWAGWRTSQERNESPLSGTAGLQNDNLETGTVTVVHVCLRVRDDRLLTGA
jgi:hypothetical protein